MTTDNIKLLKSIADLGEARVALHEAVVKGVCAKHDDNEALVGRWSAAIEERLLNVHSCIAVFDEIRTEVALSTKAPAPEILERIRELDGELAAISQSADECLAAHRDKDGALLFRRSENFEAVCVRFEALLDLYRQDYLGKSV